MSVVDDGADGAEAERQRALLAALLRAGADDELAPMLRESGARAARGLDAYRANSQGIAERALAAVFPTVQPLVGADDFAQLAREFWRAAPPQRGDLGEWGDAFPAWLATHAALAQWPYLADCARLDLALHRCERAADAAFDAASLALLGSGDPAQLRLLLLPGSALVVSAWPVGAIHAAHRLQGDAAERAFGALRGAIAAPSGERVLVVRDGWRAALHCVDEPCAAWLRSLLDGVSLADALERAGAGFDFGTWLASALRGAWLKGVVAAND